MLELCKVSVEIPVQTLEDRLTYFTLYGERCSQLYGERSFTAGYYCGIQAALKWVLDGTEISDDP